MPTAIVLSETDPIAGDTIETVRYVSCDWCQQTVVEDIWANRAWRAMYRVEDGSGLTVCENCVPAMLAEDETC